jgi:hypothetical protein
MQKGTLLFAAIAVLCPEAARAAPCYVAYVHGKLGSTIATRRWDSGTGDREDYLLAGSWECLGFVSHWYTPWRTTVPGDGLVFETGGATGSGWTTTITTPGSTISRCPCAPSCAE